MVFSPCDGSNPRYFVYTFWLFALSVLGGILEVSQLAIKGTSPRGVFVLWQMSQWLVVALTKDPTENSEKKRYLDPNTSTQQAPSAHARSAKRHY